MLSQACVIAKAGRAPQFGQHRVVGGVDQLIGKVHVARGLVADTVYREGQVTGDDGRHHHLVAGEGAGLVRTNDRYRAQRFDGRQAPNDSVATRHRPHAHRQGNGEYGGQPSGMAATDMPTTTMNISVKT